MKLSIALCVILLGSACEPPVSADSKPAVDRKLQSTEHEERGLWLFVFDPQPGPPSPDRTTFIVGEPVMLVDLSRSIEQIDAVRRYTVPTVTLNDQGERVKTDVPHYRVRIVFKDSGRRHLEAAAALQNAGSSKGLLARRAWLCLAASRFGDLSRLNIETVDGRTVLELGVSRDQLLRLLSRLDEEE